MGWGGGGVFTVIFNLSDERPTKLRDRQADTENDTKRLIAITIAITVYFSHPSGKLKLSFDRTTKNIISSVILSHDARPLFTQSAYTNT